MASFWTVIALAWVTVSISQADRTGKLVDPTKCTNGCLADEHCVINSQCKFLDIKDTCGFCVCNDGYKAQGNKCVVIKGYSTTIASTTTTEATTTTESTTTETTTTTPETTTTTTQTTTTSTIPTTTGTTTQGPPPVPDPVNCADYACNPLPPSDSRNADNPMEVRSRLVDLSNVDKNCKRQMVIPPRPCNLQGGGACFGMYCLTVSAGNDYCICPYYRTDRQCAVEKPGSCDKGTGQVLSTNTKLQNRRFRNPSNKDHGSIYGRHFAATLNDCISLCQWSQGACRSVNYGPINGVNVCEMLSTSATEKNLLATWLENAPGWQYVQVVPQSF